MWFAIRAYRQMREQDGVGSIVNISSGAGHPAGSPTLVSYGAAKSGLNHLTRSLAEEWGAKKSAGELFGAGGADDDRQLQVVRVAQG